MPSLCPGRGRADSIPVVSSAVTAGLTRKLQERCVDAPEGVPAQPGRGDLLPGWLNCRFDSLDALNDNELHEIVNHSQTLLKKRDEERKAKALVNAQALRAKAENDARAVLESKALSLKSIGRAVKGKRYQKTLYKGGRAYQHPDNNVLGWKQTARNPTGFVNWKHGVERLMEAKTEGDRVKTRDLWPLGWRISRV